MSYSSERLQKIAHPTVGNASWYLNVSAGWPTDPAANPWRNSAYIVEPPRQFPRPIWDHAGPLAAIPGRDLSEMQDWFERGDMPELAEDVNHLLERLFPEPAWDDDSWAFLQECEAATAAPDAVAGIGHRFDAYIE
ncbi:hypothetical protein IQ266_01745 [filamentous cyanobacterium LEGE 11480]|uniref:Uncharacterized protein n=1 Tax=Romeriopsis navalis LEGE 11480 TaxID=2777977 RepID=A0A928VIP4_9CYAN|nr:hypothetical protein [Romeriopsis navalis]MBE9028478.1 hypothetical protein [Romeriopsis navalis LEGE 11480]